ncbi:MAG TPA: hypothetical protein DDW65_07975 [Firmicutes bacterium]|jgi:hypothetical protein|nr:hypothetical protein [Bacillota bacterium]
MSLNNDPQDISIHNDLPVGASQTGPQRRPERPEGRPETGPRGPERRPERRPERGPRFPSGRRPGYRPYLPYRYRPYYPYQPYYPPYEQPYDTCPAGAQPYIVQPGDTLYGIANRFGISAGDIAAFNPNIDFGAPLAIGELICLPFG